MRIRLLSIACVLLALAATLRAAPGTQPAIAPATINHTALETLGWRLACQAYTFRSLSLFETLDVLRDLGIRYVELYPGQRLAPDNPARTDHRMSAENLEKLIAKLKANGVQAVNFGVVGLSKDEKASREVFEFARKLRIETIVSEPAEDAFDTLATLADEYKINVALHNHPKPSRYWDPDTVLKVTANRSARIGACADTGHWYRSGLVPVECLKKLDGRIISLHFKDLSEAKRDVPWGTGKGDAKAQLAELHRQKIKPVIAIEYETGSGSELVDNVRKCCEFLSATAEELAKEPARR